MYVVSDDCYVALADALVASPGYCVRELCLVLLLRETTWAIGGGLISHGKLKYCLNLYVYMSTNYVLVSYSTPAAHLTCGQRSLYVILWSSSSSSLGNRGDVSLYRTKPYCCGGVSYLAEKLKQGTTRYKDHSRYKYICLFDYIEIRVQTDRQYWNELSSHRNSSSSSSSRFLRTIRVKSL